MLFNQLTTIPAVDLSILLPADCFKCSDGYVANLGFSCTKCTNYTGIDLMFALALAVMALVVTIVVPLPARMRDAVTGFVERARRCLPRQSIQIFVVNWQILTQVRYERGRCGCSNSWGRFTPGGTKCLLLRVIFGKWWRCVLCAA